jgi:hypothetical protein
MTKQIDKFDSFVFQEKDRCLEYTAGSWDRPRRTGKGRFDPFAKPSENDCYLRIAVAVVSALNVRFLANAAQTTPIGLDRCVHVGEARVAACPVRGPGNTPPRRRPPIDEANRSQLPSSTAPYDP